MSEDTLSGSIKVQKYFVRTFFCSSKSLSTKCRYYIYIYKYIYTYIYIYIYIYINVCVCVRCVYAGVRYVCSRVRGVCVCVCVGFVCFNDGVDCRKHYQTRRQELKQRSHYKAGIVST